MSPFEKFLLLCSLFWPVLFLVVADNLTEPRENENVDAIISHLNENSNSTYVYKEGQYVDAQLKVSIFANGHPVQ